MISACRQISFRFDVCRTNRYRNCPGSCCGLIKILALPTILLRPITGVLALRLLFPDLIMFQHEQDARTGGRDEGGKPCTILPMLTDESHPRPIRVNDTDDGFFVDLFGKRS